MDGNCDVILEPCVNHVQLYDIRVILLLSRRNYLLVTVLAFVLCFLRNPLALAALACCTLGLLCCNDPFATTLK